MNSVKLNGTRSAGRMEYKKKASMVVGNMCGLVLNGKELVPYVPFLMPELVACVRDSNPEMRQYGGTALSALLKGMAAGQLGSSFDVLLTDLERSDSNNSLSVRKYITSPEVLDLTLAPLNFQVSEGDGEPRC